MRMREYAFSAAAWEKLVYERNIGVASLQVLPAGSVAPQSWKLISVSAEELLQHFSTRAPFNGVTRGVVLVREESGATVSTSGHQSCLDCRPCPLSEWR